MKEAPPPNYPASGYVQRGSCDEWVGWRQNKNSAVLKMQTQLKRECTCQRVFSASEPPLRACDGSRWSPAVTRGHSRQKAAARRIADVYHLSIHADTTRHSPPCADIRGGLPPGVTVCLCVSVCDPEEWSIRGTRSTAPGDPGLWFD